MRRPPGKVPDVLSTLPAGGPPRGPEPPRRPLPRRSEEMSGELSFREYSSSVSPHYIWKHLAHMLMQIRWSSVNAFRRFSFPPCRTRTVHRLTVFVRRCTVLVRQGGKEKRRKAFTELHLICISIWARCFQM